MKCRKCGKKSPPIIFGYCKECLKKLGWKEKKISATNVPLASWFRVITAGLNRKDR